VVGVEATAQKVLVTTQHGDVFDGRSLVLASGAN
jgi:hypothetical protein